MLRSKQPASVRMQLILPISWSTHSDQPYQSLVNTRKRSPSLVQRSYERTSAGGPPAILKIPTNPANPAPDNPPNTRKHSQTLMISRKRSQTLVQRSYERTSAGGPPAILKIPTNPANPAPDNPPNTRKHSQTLMISRKRSPSLVQRSYEPTSAGGPPVILRIPRNPANPAPDNPPNTRKHTQTLMISRKRSPSLVQRSYEATSAGGTPAIPKIPKNPTNPAPDNPPNTRKRSQSLIQRSYERTRAGGTAAILRSQ